MPGSSSKGHKGPRTESKPAWTPRSDQTSDQYSSGSPEKTDKTPEVKSGWTFRRDHATEDQQDLSFPSETDDKESGAARAQHIRENEFVLYGWNACKRVFASRPKDILRMFFSKERSTQLMVEKKWCAQQRIPYRLLSSQDLARVAAGTHHEGIVMVVNPVQPLSAHNLVRQNFTEQNLFVALDRVTNTHNLGSIMRAGAFFGAHGLIMSMEAGQAAVTSSAARMAEGALEDLPLYQSTDLPSTLRELRSRNVFVLGAQADSDRSIYETEVTFPCVVVLGNEREGLSERVQKRCDALVNIPGIGKMQSLNVALAGGVILAELRRRQAIVKA